MTWKGIVSHDGHSIITAREPTARAAQARSSCIGDSQPVTRMPHGLDRGGGPELFAQPPDANVDDVRSGVEAVSPDLRKEPLPAHHLSCVSNQVIEQPELAIGKVGDPVLDTRLAPGKIELEPTGAHG